MRFNSEKPDYQALHESIVAYLRFSKSKANWLGFVADGNSGHGLGWKFARA